MNILLINHYAGSDRLGMEYRPFYLGREWVSQGHKVTIIASGYSHLRGTQPQVHHDLEISTEEGVRYCWLRTPRYAGNGAARVANMLAFVGKLMRYARRIAREEKPDIVICSSTYPLDIYPGELISRYSNARLIYEVHDLWPLTPMLLGGYSRWHPYIRLLQHAEDRAYAQSDAVVSILPNAKRHMMSRGMDAAKFIYIPNGIPVSRLNKAAHPEASPQVATIISQERERQRFLVGYAGSLTLSMDVNLLLDTATMPQASGISFLIAGDGPTAVDLRDRLESLQIDNVHMLGRIPKAEVHAFLAGMDALAVPWHSNPLYRYGVSPNKIFDYMFAARPILQASDASNDLVAEARCGFTVAPGNPDVLASAIGRVRDLSISERARLGTNGREFVCRNHDFKNLAAEFLVAIGAVGCDGLARSEDHAVQYAVSTS